MTSVIDDIKEIVLMMRERTDGVVPHFIPGHRREINNILLNESQDRVASPLRYPLLTLFTPFDIVNQNGIREITLNIGIFESTDKNYTTEERNEYIIKPVLYPLYELFFECIRESGLFFWPNDLEIPLHTQVDRPLWSIEEREGRVAHILTDPLDAILIRDLKLNQFLRTCK